MKNTKLKLIKADTYEGYELNNLLEYLSEKGLKEKFDKWFAGSTMANQDGKMIVYKWDLEDFLAGRPNLD